MGIGFMLSEIGVKIRYGWKKYLLFLLLTILFIVLYYIQLSKLTVEDIENNSVSFIFYAFLYVPVTINLMIQIPEYSKCSYLVPRTQYDRKHFFIVQNAVRILSSLLIITILLFSGIIINPLAKEILIQYYFLIGTSFSLAMGSSGYSSYNYLGKKRSYKRYLVTYIISVIVISTLILCIMMSFYVMSTELRQIIVILMNIAAFGFDVFYGIRFMRSEASYENINESEHRLMSRMSSSMM